MSPLNVEQGVGMKRGATSEDGVRRAPWRAKLTRLGAAAVVILGAVTGAVITSGPARAASQGPCDIYAAGGTPCVAAHSTTRALYGSYAGSLYQVRRSSDNSTRNIGVASGYA